MSGGTFDYIQHRFTDIIDTIEQEIKDNNAPSRMEKPEDSFVANNFNKETINELKRGIICIKAAQIYINRIDRLLVGDDGEDTFHKNLMKDLLDAKIIKIKTK